MPITVLQITLSASIGGGPEHVDKLLQHLPTEVTSLMAAPQDYPYWERYMARVGAQKMFVLPRRQFRLGYLLKLALFARRNKVNILHSHGKGAGLYGRLAGMLTGIPCVHTFHGIHLGDMRPAHRAIYGRLEAFFGRHSARCIAVSPGERDQILALGFAPGPSLRLVENGVDLSPFTRTGQPLGCGPLRLVHITRFDHAKNSDLLVDIASALKDLGRLSEFKFTVLGDGEGRAPVERAAKMAGVWSNFEFIGIVEDVRPFLREAFCYLSTSRWEGMPLSVLESMAEGLPVIASDVVGNRDCVLPEVTGFLYPLESPGDAAKVLLTLCANPGQWAKLSQTARQECIKRHDVTVMAGKVHKIYREALGYVHNQLPPA